MIGSWSGAASYRPGEIFTCGFQRHEQEFVWLQGFYLLGGIFKAGLRLLLILTTFNWTPPSLPSLPRNMAHPKASIDLPVACCGLHVPNCNSLLFPNKLICWHFWACLGLPVVLGQHPLPLFVMFVFSGLWDTQGKDFVVFIFWHPEPGAVPAVIGGLTKIWWMIEWITVSSDCFYKGLYTCEVFYFNVRTAWAKTIFTVNLVTLGSPQSLVVFEKIIRILLLDNLVD